MLREALSAARGIGDAGMRTKASAGVAKCLPAEERQNVLAEALSVARGIDDAESRGRALQEVAQRLPTGEALVVARGIDDAEGRAQALAEVAERLGQISELSMRQWVETARVLAMHTRSDCIADFTAILPLIQVLGGETAVRSLGRSIACVGTWWPETGALRSKRPNLTDASGRLSIAKSSHLYLPRHARLRKQLILELVRPPQAV